MAREVALAEHFGLAARSLPPYRERAGLFTPFRALMVLRVRVMDWLHPLIKELHMAAMAMDLESDLVWAVRYVMMTVLIVMMVFMAVSVELQFAIFQHDLDLIVHPGYAVMTMLPVTANAEFDHAMFLFEGRLTVWMAGDEQGPPF